MNRESRGKVTLTYEEVRRCFETGKLAEAMRQLLDDEYVMMVKEATYSKISKIAREAVVKDGAIKAPDAQFLDEKFYTELACEALNEGLAKSVKSGNLTTCEQNVADSLTRELAVEVLTGMSTEFALRVSEVTMNSLLNEIVDAAVEEAFDKFFG